MTPTRQSRERLAWIVLILSLVTFLALAIAGPLAIRWYLLNSELEQTARLTTTSGTIVVERSDQLTPLGVTGGLEDIPEGSTITTDASSEGTLDFTDPRSGQVLSTVQIYGNTHVRIRLMRSPRFELSQRSHRIVMDLLSGRVRTRISVDVQQPVRADLQTPQGQASFVRPGSYLVEVAQNETTVAVREGSATVTAEGNQIELNEGELSLTTIRPGQLLQALPAARNLVTDGDFPNGLDPAWTVRRQKNVESEPDPEIGLTTSAGRRAVSFARSGAGLDWALVGIRQEINRDVRELTSLRLHMAVLVQFQDLFNCGALGTECPVMVKIVYRDAQATTYEWLKGFYANSDPLGRPPLRCVTCPPPDSGSHEQVTGGGWRTYDSPNLIEVFKQVGLPAVSITAIDIYASGHAFQSLVSEVELLAQE